MSVTTARLTNSAYGYPKGAKRRIEPRRLLCLHITGNKNNLGPSAASNERNYANRSGSGGPSAHDYINRDGSRVNAISAASYAAWSNGDVTKPDLTVPGVKAVVALAAKGFNANEDYYREVECVGYPGTAPLTPEQLEVVAQLLARDARVTGLPITRATVHLHADLNTVNRPSCPFPPASRERRVTALIVRANEILNPPVVEPPAPEPPPEPEPDATPYSQADLDAAHARGKAEGMNTVTITVSDGRPPVTITEV